jgi:RNA polymerase sigma-70 factor (ECF subfamily)
MTGAEPFETFVRQYQDLVFRTAFRLVGRRAEAEDIAQTVFLRAFERFTDLATNPAAPGWLKTVATNLSLNHLSRYRSRWRLFSEMSAGESDEPEFGDTVASNADTSQATAEGMQQRQLARALSGLPDHQRVPIVLFHYDDKTYDEIATLLGVSLAKVKTDIHRGREALRAALSSEA